MSEYHLVSVDFKDEECLVEALEEIGYNPEVHKEAVNLIGYQNDKREQKAHIVLPKAQVGSASNDIGFERQSNGSYKLHVSAYDQSRWTKKQEKLTQLYSKQVIIKQTKSKTKYKMTSETVDADGSIRLRVRVRR